MHLLVQRQIANISDRRFYWPEQVTVVHKCYVNSKLVEASLHSEAVEEFQEGADQGADVESVCNFIVKIQNDVE